MTPSMFLAWLLLCTILGAGLIGLALRIDHDDDGQQLDDPPLHPLDGPVGSIVEDGELR